MIGRYVFHVHTRRCGHAEEIEDEAYVRRAIAIGADSIYFTDHAPFPKNPFRNRMDYEQLDEYLTTLKSLRDKYEGVIQVIIGLEVEFLPSFSGYYEMLRNKDDIDLLILGQHHSEIASGKYTFELDDKSEEWKYLMDGQIAGTESGYFDVVAHPDRLFKREKVWTLNMEQASRQFIDCAISHNIPVEKNLASMRQKRQFWNEFWELVPEDASIVTGCDAHAVDEVVAWWK
ncbi:MAG: PHP domain-containing protein [Clostridiales bacterium]|nr:PHP domain-containing protein [Clostridiales bacterium]